MPSLLRWTLDEMCPAIDGPNFSMASTNWLASSLWSPGATVYAWMMVRTEESGAIEIIG